MSSFEKWIISGFAIIGAFFTSGIGASGLASLVSVWTIPYAGFCAAFSVVYIAGITAPQHPKKYSIFVFSVGALVAWFFLNNYTYPESYTTKAYQPTLIPLMVTLMGGTLGLLTNFILLKNEK